MERHKLGFKMHLCFTFSGLLTELISEIFRTSACASAAHWEQMGTIWCFGWPVYPPRVSRCWPLCHWKALLLGCRGVLLSSNSSSLLIHESTWLTVVWMWQPNLLAVIVQLQGMHGRKRRKRVILLIKRKRADQILLSSIAIKVQPQFRRFWDAVENVNKNWVKWFANDHKHIFYSQRNLVNTSNA